MLAAFFGSFLEMMGHAIIWKILQGLGRSRKMICLDIAKTNILPDEISKAFKNDARSDLLCLFLLYSFFISTR